MHAYYVALLNVYIGIVRYICINELKTFLTCCVVARHIRTPTDAQALHMKISRSLS